MAVSRLYQNLFFFRFFQHHIVFPTLSCSHLVRDIVRPQKPHFFASFHLDIILPIHIRHNLQIAILHNNIRERKRCPRRIGDRAIKMNLLTRIDIADAKKRQYNEKKPVHLKYCKKKSFSYLKNHNLHVKKLLSVRKNNKNKGMFGILNKYIPIKMSLYLRHLILKNYCIFVIKSE